MIQTAKKYVKCGVNVLPLKADKSPDVAAWGGYQEVMFNDWSKQFTKIGVIAGSISGGLEVIDIDCKYDLTGNLFKDYCRLINFNTKAIIPKLVIQKTVSNGYHFIYRCKTIEGNKKLASRDATPEEMETGEKVKVLIETRGEGGYIAAYPSEGYSLLQNDFESIPDISDAERDVLMSCARALNKIDTQVYKPARKAVEWADNGLKPWEDFDERGDTLDLLYAHGWENVFSSGERIMLKRPGKTSAKTSGSYNTALKLFKTFSTSTPFEAEKGHTPSAVFAVLECNGDFSEAGRKLYELGFGSRSDVIEKNKTELNKKDDYGFISKELDEAGYLADFYNGRLQKGLSTGFEALDKHFVWKAGNIVINNGHNNVGKSTVLWYLMTLTNLLHGWKWIVYSAENREAAVRRRFIEFKYGKDYNKLTSSEVMEGNKWAYDNFAIIKSNEIETYDTVIEKCTRLMTLKPFKGLLIDPYNALDVPFASKSHEYHYKSVAAFRIFAKKFDCTTVINTHAVTEALRKTDSDGYPVAPNSADTEGGGKFANRADEFLTLHRLTQSPSQKTITQIHVRKVKETETGGEPTPLTEPVKLQMKNFGGFFGFYDEKDNCPMRDLLMEGNLQPLEMFEEETKSFEDDPLGSYNGSDEF